MKAVFDWEDEITSVFELSITHYNMNRIWVASVTKLKDDRYLANFEGRTILDQRIFLNIDEAKSYVDNKLINMGYKIVSVNCKVLL